MPNGAAANLAIGGALPVCTLSGKAEALASGRPASSLSSAGISIVKRGVLGERLRERDLAHLGRLVVLVEHRRERLAAGGRGAAAARRELARDRRREAHAHRPDRQARRVGALALAAEVGREGGAHGEAEALLDRASRPSDWRAAAMPLPQTRRIAAPFGSGRSQRAISVRSACRLVDAARLQQLLAHVAADDPAAPAARRCPRPRTRRWRARVASTAGPFRRSRKCWSSSIVAPPPGCSRDDGRPAGGEGRTAWGR